MHQINSLTTGFSFKPIPVLIPENDHGGVGLKPNTSRPRGFAPRGLFCEHAMSLKHFILDALTGSPAKGFTPAELAREHQAQMIGIVGGVIGFAALCAVIYGGSFLLRYLATN